MGAGIGEGRLTARLFLVAPVIPVAEVANCLSVACEIGDVASLLAPESLARELVHLARSKDVALLTTGDPGNAARLGCDGIQIDAASASVAESRAIVGREGIVGAFAGSSRHFAMEAAEAGADYIAFAQNEPAAGGEPILGWWTGLFEIPAVAFDAVAADELDILLPQNPDFIRPSDAMWQSPEKTRAIIAAMMNRLSS